MSGLDPTTAEVLTPRKTEVVVSASHKAARGVYDVIFLIFPSFLYGYSLLRLLLLAAFT